MIHILVSIHLRRTINGNLLVTIYFHFSIYKYRTSNHLFKKPTLGSSPVYAPVFLGMKSANQVIFQHVTRIRVSTTFDVILD